MNDDVASEAVVSEEAPAQPDLGLRADGKPRKRRKLKPEERRPQIRTVAERRAAAIKRAKEMEAERKARIPLRLGISLEMFEGLVAIGERIGGSKLANVATRSMAMGMTQWARELKLHLDAVPDDPLTVFETMPPVAKAYREYGVDEQREREGLRVAAQETEKQRDALTTQLHVPGRKRAFG